MIFWDRRTKMCLTAVFTFPKIKLSSTFHKITHWTKSKSLFWNICIYKQWRYLLGKIYSVGSIRDPGKERLLQFHVPMSKLGRSACTHCTHTHNIYLCKHGCPHRPQADTDHSHNHSTNAPILMRRMESLSENTFTCMQGGSVAGLRHSVCHVDVPDLMLAPHIYKHMCTCKHTHTELVQSPQAP